MVAEVLVELTSPTIGTYSAHATIIWNSFEANNNEIGTLTQSDCKENAQAGNEYAIESSGFRSSNCIRDYNKKVEEEVKNVNDALRLITPGMDDVSLNVVRGYIPPNNPMVNGEEIERRINGTFIDVMNQWESVRPDLTSMRTSFRTALLAATTTLGGCFNRAKSYMETMSAILMEQVQECALYNGSRREQFIASLMQSFIEKSENL